MSVLLPPSAGPGPAPEAILFRHAQAGCPASLNRLMARHDGLVQAVVRQQALGPLLFADALQAGRLGLWRAIRGYDPQRGLAFSTYAWPCIAHQVWAAVKAARRPSPTPLPLRSPSSHASDPVTAYEAAAIQAAVLDLVTRLPDRLRTVVVAHYGLGAAPPTSLAAIGRTMGLSRERIRQLHSEALVWLRQPAHGQHLRSLLDRHTLADYQTAAAQTQAWRQRRRRRHGH